MGGSASTRRVTVMNEDVSGVVKISDSVVDRLRGQLREPILPKKTSEMPPSWPPPQASSPTTPSLAPIMDHPVDSPPTVQDLLVPPASQHKPEPATPRAATKYPQGLSPFTEDPHLVAMRVREEKEAELRVLEQQWRQKLKDIQKRHADQNQLSVEQFHAALAEVEALFFKPTTTPMCEEGQDKVQRCYQDNPKQSLRCSREVAAFTECVDLTRLSAVTRKG